MPKYLERKDGSAMSLEETVAKLIDLLEPALVNEPDVRVMNDMLSAQVQKNGRCHCGAPLVTNEEAALVAACNDDVLHTHPHMVDSPEVGLVSSEDRWT